MVVLMRNTTTDNTLDYFEPEGNEPFFTWK